VLLVVWIVCPEPDQAAEALEDRRDDSIVRECAPDFFACGEALCRGPGVQLTELGGEVRLEFTPALRSRPDGRKRRLQGSARPRGRH
jgi:hypothetical protein